MSKARRKLLGIDGGNIFKKGNLTHFLEMLGADDVESKLWYGDATVKQDLIVEGRVFGSVSSDTLTEEAQDFKVHRDLIVQDDATVKDTLYVNGPIKGVVEEAQDFWVHKDLIVQDDATVKDDLYIEGQIFGAGDTQISTPGDIRLTCGIGDIYLYGDQLAEIKSGGSILVTSLVGTLELRSGNAGIWLNSQGYDIVASDNVQLKKDLVVQDDATVKGQITVEDDRAGGYGTAAGITDDFTTQGMVFRVVKGLIVKAAYKSG